MHVALYWLVRTGIFLVVYAVLWLLGWFDVFAVLVAFVAAWALGYIAFPGLRRKAQEQMDGWITRGHAGVEADAEVEDAEVAGEDAADGDAR
jgi:ABC-type bacteriocin/lantibiotic exporter with double-glycine peptidase domain